MILPFQPSIVTSPGSLLPLRWSLNLAHLTPPLPLLPQPHKDKELAQKNAFRPSQTNDLPASPRIATRGIVQRTSVVRSPAAFP